jgi:hypothetical protein
MRRLVSSNSIQSLATSATGKLKNAIIHEHKQTARNGAIAVAGCR